MFLNRFFFFKWHPGIPYSSNVTLICVICVSCIVFKVVNAAESENCFRAETFKWKKIYSKITKHSFVQLLSCEGFVRIFRVFCDSKLSVFGSDKTRLLKMSFWAFENCNAHFCWFMTKYYHTCSKSLKSDMEKLLVLYVFLKKKYLIYFLLVEVVDLK